MDAGAAPASKKDRAIAIALSMDVDNSGYTAASDLDLTADKWCVQWIAFVMKASGCAYYPDFTSQANVSGAISFFGSNFDLRSNKTPVKGDWVMYSKSGEQFAHVGLIVNAENVPYIETVEGNLGGTVKKVDQYNYNNGVGNFTVYGFATPTWV